MAESEEERRVERARAALRDRIETPGTPERGAYFDGHSEGYQSGYLDGRRMAIRVILNTLRHDRVARVLILSDVVETFGQANGIVAAHGDLVVQIERHGK